MAGGAWSPASLLEQTAFGESRPGMSSLFDELGLDPEDFEWRDLALCKAYKIENAAQDIFFDRYESDPEAAKAADEMCLHCPVISECFFAGANGQYGVWGGVYWNGSGKPDKNKNSHKTEEVWDDIRAKVAEGE
jgi:hypothetical protein